MLAYPALLTRTSSRPNRDTAVPTAAWATGPSVTSSGTTASCPPNSAARSLGTRDLLPVVLASNAAKVRAVADAQVSGILPARFPASVLLGLVLHLSGFWSANVPEFDAMVDDAGPAARRKVVVEAVAALLS